MSNRYTIPDMTNRLILASSEIGMLLSVDGLKWDKKDYAMYFVMLEMWKKTSQPNQSQVTVALGAMLRFYARLIAQLERSDFKTNVEQEFWRLRYGYESLLSGGGSN